MHENRLVVKAKSAKDDEPYTAGCFIPFVSVSNGVAQTDYVLHENGIATNESWKVGTNAAVVTRSVDALNRLQSLVIGGTGYVQHFAYAPDNLFATISNDEAIVTYTYADDRSESGYTLTLANGTTFTRSVTRDPNRPGLVTSVTNRCGLTVRGLSYTHDDLSRPTTRNDDTFGYNMRGEVSFAQINGNTESHTYDLSGNSTFAAFNTETNFFTANNLNQYSAISTLGAPAPLRETTPNYDSDGNLIAFGSWSYTYDSASRLTSVTSNGVLLVTNAYDYRGRRVRKTTPTAVHTFIYDDWNLIRETVVYPTGSADVFEYFWGRDLSGSLQGAGGIGGLLYMKRNGTIYIPFADANGNVTAYVDASGAIVAEYVYDAFGRTVSQSGFLADVFRQRFSSKYFDAETGLYYYGYRFYCPQMMRWLNRDPIEERGGLNLYVICRNCPIPSYDKDGCAYFIKRRLDYLPWIDYFSQNADRDIDNTELVHEQLIFEDSRQPSDYGYGPKGVHTNDNVWKERKWVHVPGRYNDCVMRKAVVQVKPLPYSLLGNERKGVPKYNCQDYADELRSKYYELLRDPRVRCECGLKTGGR